MRFSGNKSNFLKNFGSNPAFKADRMYKTRTGIDNIGDGLQSLDTRFTVNYGDSQLGGSRKDGTV